MAAAVCFKVESDLTMTIVAGDRQHSILLDGQAKPPGLPSLRFFPFFVNIFAVNLARLAGSVSSRAWL